MLIWCTYTSHYDYHHSMIIISLNTLSSLYLPALLVSKNTNVRSLRSLRSFYFLSGYFPSVVQTDYFNFNSIVSFLCPLHSAIEPVCCFYCDYCTLATSCEEFTHWKRPWCWEELGARGEGDDGGWDGWMASLTRWTWVSVDSGSWWWTGRPGVLRFMGSQRVGHDWGTDLIWSDCILQFKIFCLVLLCIFCFFTDIFYFFICFKHVHNCSLKHF